MAVHATGLHAGWSGQEAGVSQPDGWTQLTQGQMAATELGEEGLQSSHCSGTSLGIGLPWWMSAFASLGFSSALTTLPLPPPMSSPCSCPSDSHLLPASEGLAASQSQPTTTTWPGALWLTNTNTEQQTQNTKSSPGAPLSLKPVSPVGEHIFTPRAYVSAHSSVGDSLWDRGFYRLCGGDW